LDFYWVKTGLSGEISPKQIDNSINQLSQIDIKFSIPAKTLTMNYISELLKTQTIDTYHWVEKLIADIAHEKWFDTPEILESSFAWQLGHLTLSQYYYTVVLVKGPQKDFAESIHLKKYSEFFAKGQKKKELASNVSVQELLGNWQAMKALTIETLSNIQDIDLQNETFKMPKPHPFVVTIENSISWNIKHNMWHCGQMAMLKRVVDTPLNLGI